MHVKQNISFSCCSLNTGDQKGTCVHVYASVRAPTWVIHETFVLCFMVMWTFYLLIMGCLKDDDQIVFKKTSANQKIRKERKQLLVWFIVVAAASGFNLERVGCAEILGFMQGVIFCSYWSDHAVNLEAVRSVNSESSQRRHAQLNVKARLPPPHIMTGWLSGSKT